MLYRLILLIGFEMSLPTYKLNLIMYLGWGMRYASEESHITIKIIGWL